MKMEIAGNSSDLIIKHQWAGDFSWNLPTLERMLIITTNLLFYEDFMIKYFNKKCRK